MDDLLSIAAPSMREIAKDAIDTLDDLLLDYERTLNVSYSKDDERQRYEEQLAYLRAAFKEADRGE